MIPLFLNRRVPGAILLPRHRAGQLNWPRCAICHRVVDAYGIENETEASIEIWAECTGMLLDPATGRAVAFSIPKHPKKKGSIVLLKGPGFSANRLTDIIARQAFFSPEGERQWAQNLSADGAGKRWGAG